MHILRISLSIFFFVLIVIFFSTPDNAYAYSPVELVVNGGFETDPLGTGWIQSSSGFIGAWTGLTS